MTRRIFLLLSLTLLLSACRVLPEPTPEPVPTIAIATLPPASPTPFPSPTPLPSPTPTPQPEPEAQAQPSLPPFIPLQQAPLFAPPFAHPEPACGWMGVAGQVFDAEGRPLNGVVISVVGNVAGQAVDALGFTGLATAYGPGGYEVTLHNGVAPGIFWVQLFDLAAQPLTQPLNFAMLTGCETSLAVINFRQLDAAFQPMLP